MSEASMPKRALRGVKRAVSGELVKASITLPRELLTSVDLAVVDRKRREPSFNRSALIEEALLAHMTRAWVDSDE